MALMYFKDGKTEKQGKVWMGKAAVRKIVEQKDAKNKELEEECEFWHTKYKELDAKYLSLLNRHLVVSIGGFIGYSILLAILWRSCN